MTAPQQERNSEASAHENVEVSAPKTRQDRMAQHNEKCERIIHYLRSGKHQDGLSKNQQRVVRSQAKNYVFDDTSKLLIYYILTFVMFVMLLPNVLDDSVDSTSTLTS